MLLNCGVGEDSWESLGLQVDPASTSKMKWVLNIHWRTDVVAETPILWLPDAKNWLIGKYPDAGKDWKWEEKGITEEEMAGWHHRLNRYEFELAKGVWWWTRGILISDSSTFSKSTLNIWKFIVHVLLKPGLENFEHYIASLWDECICAVFWTFFGLAFLWDWNENWPFPVLWPLLKFPNLLAYWMQHYHSIIF